MARCPSIKLIIGSLLIVLIVIQLLNSFKVNEGFGALDVPSGNAIVDPPVNALDANEGFRKVLSYLSKNPKDSGAFLNFLKTSFFTESAKFNSDINYAGLQEKWKGGTFKDKSTDV